MAAERKRKLGTWAAGLALLVLLGLAPYGLDNYYLHIGILAMIFLFPALGLNLILGYTGLLSLAQGAFFGIGAYTSALLAIHLKWPFWLSFLAAGVMCAAIALVMGIPALRLRRYSFVMSTLGIVAITEAVAKNWVSLTRGDMGLTGIPRPRLALWTEGAAMVQVWQYYYLALVLALLGVAAFFWLIYSPAGRCMVAIRDEETLAESQGVQVWSYKLIVFAFSAGFAGMGGSIFAHYMTVLTPVIFQMYYTLAFLIIVYGGGMGTFAGVLLGAFVFVAMPEALRVAPHARMLVYGLVLVLLAFRFPGGLASILVRLADWANGRLRREGAS